MEIFVIGCIKIYVAENSISYLFKMPVDQALNNYLLHITFIKKQNCIPDITIFFKLLSLEKEFKFAFDCISAPMNSIDSKSVFKFDIKLRLSK